MMKTVIDSGKPTYGFGSIAAMVKPSLDHCFFGLLEEVLGMGASKVRGTYQKKNYGQGPHHVPLYIYIYIYIYLSRQEGEMVYCRCMLAPRQGRNESDY